MRITMKVLGVAAPLLLMIGLASCSTPPPAAAGPTLPAVGCYDFVFAEFPTAPDLRFTGALTARNARYFSSSDGTCTGPVTQVFTVVKASDSVIADDECEALGQGLHLPDFLSDLGSVGWTGLSGLWECSTVENI